MMGSSPLKIHGNPCWQYEFMTQTELKRINIKYPFTGMQYKWQCDNWQRQRMSGQVIYRAKKSQRFIVDCCVPPRVPETRRKFSKYDVQLCRLEHFDSYQELSTSWLRVHSEGYPKISHRFYAQCHEWPLKQMGPVWWVGFKLPSPKHPSRMASPVAYFGVTNQYSIQPTNATGSQFRADEDNDISRSVWCLKTPTRISLIQRSRPTLNLQPSWVDLSWARFNVPPNTL